MAADAPEPDAAGVDPWANPQWIVDVMSGMRKLLQRTGTVLGAAATALLAGLGYAQLHNIFPIPKNTGWYTVALGVLFLIAAFGGAAWLTAIFFMAQRQILIGTYWRDDLGGADDKVADRIESEYARQENAASIRDVELRAIRLGAVARALSAAGDKRAKATNDESVRLWAVVHVALVRTAATVLEERSRRAFRGRQTIAALACSVVGIVGIFALSDYYKGQRDLYVSREKCAQAEQNGIVGACAPFETAAQTKQRHDAEAAAKRKKASAAAAALASLSSAQRRALVQAAACETAIAALPKASRPSSQAQSRAVALCSAK
jgi:hypothetical protein